MYARGRPQRLHLWIFREENFGADCSSLTELMLCDAVGIHGEDIMFSSNDTPEKDYAQAWQFFSEESAPR